MVPHNYPRASKHVFLIMVLLVSLSAAAPAQAAGTTDVTLEPSSTTVAPGDTTTVDVVVANADAGVGSVAANVSITDPSVANITDVSVAGAPTFDLSTVTEANTTAAIEASAMDTETDTGQLVVATVTIEATQAGTTDLTLSVASLDDENAEAYSVADAAGATVEVLSSSTLNSSIGVTPTEATIPANTTATFDIVVDSAVGGVGSVDATVSLAPTGPAVIETATVSGTPTSETTNISDDNSSVDVQASGMNVSTGDSAPIVTVTVRGEQAGTAELGTSVDAVTDQTGKEYAITGTDVATLNINAETTSSQPETTVDVLLDGAPAGLQSYNVTVSGPSTATITSVEAGVIAGQSFQITEGGEDDSTVTARGVDLAGTVGATSDQLTLYTLTIAGVNGTSELDTTVHRLEDGGGEAMDTDRVVLSGQQSSAPTNPFPDGVPGLGSNQPGDLDDDGLYEDVNGDGEANFDDAVDLAFAETGDLTQAQLEALDFNGDGSVNFEDAVELAFSI